MSLFQEIMNLEFEDEGNEAVYLLDIELSFYCFIEFVEFHAQKKPVP